MITDIIKSAEQKMQKSFEALKISFGKIRTGRAHTGILDHVTIDYTVHLYQSAKLQM